MSATRHSTAKAKCITDFFTDANGASSSEGDTLCNIFPWVDVGIMGGLWVLLAALLVRTLPVINYSRHSLPPSCISISSSRLMGRRNVGIMTNMIRFTTLLNLLRKISLFMGKMTLGILGLQENTWAVKTAIINMFANKVL